MIHALKKLLTRATHLNRHAGACGDWTLAQSLLAQSKHHSIESNDHKLRTILYKGLRATIVGDLPIWVQLSTRLVIPNSQAVYSDKADYVSDWNTFRILGQVLNINESKINVYEEAITHKFDRLITRTEILMFGDALIIGQIPLDTVDTESDIDWEFDEILLKYREYTRKEVMEELTNLYVSTFHTT